MRHLFKTWVRGRRWRAASRKSGRTFGRVSLVGVGLLLLVAAVSVTAVLAAGGYELPWWTVDGGGGTSNGGAYTLTGTAGQPDAGAMSGGTYTLSGGFWASAGEGTPQQFKILMPLVLHSQ